MSPFQKNLKRLLIFCFTAVSVVLVIMGINRSNNGALSAVPAAGQDTIPPPLKTAASTKGSVTFRGKTYQTPWGNAVASISVTNGKITSVTMPQVPPSPPSQYAEPYLVAQALASGSSNIQGVSGATYTSIAFKSSLESAITQATAQGQTITPTSGTSAIIAQPTQPTVPRRYEDD